MMTERICKECGRPLGTANRADNPGAFAQLKYCSLECRKRAENRRYYQRHKPSILQRILRSRKSRQVCDEERKSHADDR